MKRFYRYLFLAFPLGFSLACQALALPGKEALIPTPTLAPQSGGVESPGETPMKPTQPLSETCAAAVDGIYNLRSGLDFPSYFQQENPLKQGGEFDPNRYFDVLTHIKMEPGYTLDYAYRYDGMGGGPMLYARKTGDEPYQTAAELQAALPPPTPGNPDSFGWNEQYLSHVRLDGTPEGYLEFTLLALTGGQFYLFWHSGYYDEVVMCSLDAMKYADDEMEGFQLDFTPEVRSAAEKIDYDPAVKISDQSVEVRLVTFTKWGGFAEEVYILDRGQPSRLLESRTETLVEYDCGIMF